MAGYIYILASPRAPTHGGYIYDCHPHKRASRGPPTHMQPAPTFPLPNPVDPPHMAAIHVAYRCSAPFWAAALRRRVGVERISRPTPRCGQVSHALHATPPNASAATPYAHALMIPTPRTTLRPRPVH